MTRVYGIHPWDVQRYTLRELDELARDLVELQRLATQEVSGDG